MFENVFETINSGFAQALYEEYLRDPSGVPQEWRALFDSGITGETPPTMARANGRRVSVEDTAGDEKELETEERPETVGSTEAITGPSLRLLQNMEASLDVPTATSFREIEVSTLWAYRASLNRELAERGEKLSFTHLIGWAIIQACEEFPVMAQAVTKAEGEPHRYDPGSINLGLAVDVERKDGSRGLLVPVIKGAEEMDFAEYREEYERLVAGARDNKLMPDAYMGGTITLTNPGVIGTVASVPRLMKGQGSIIATGAIRTTTDGRLMTVTSTYDHRLIQGATSGVFLQRIDALLQGESDFYVRIAHEMDVRLGVVEVEKPLATAETSPGPATPAEPEEGMVSSKTLQHVAAAMSLVKTHRTHGHRAARLDPLGSEPPGDPALDPERIGLTQEIMEQIPCSVLRTYVSGNTLAEALPKLRDTYCGTMAYEIEHIDNHEERVWLRQVIESGEHRRPLSEKQKKRLLEDLTKTDGLERFLHRSYLGHKRFGIEGLDSLVPMLGVTIELAAGNGTKEVVIGMAHRGRLNVLSHVVGVSYETLLAEFEGGLPVEETLAPTGGTGDVKYHHGSVGEFVTSDGTRVGVTVMPNPSHLEAVDPVVEGRTRAAQTDRQQASAPRDTNLVLPVLIHGDAAFAAQGVVAETFNLSRLDGYTTGGTIHIIANNQVGFTTDPREARSTDNASSLALGFDVPIIHVNADDAEACLAAVNLAMMYRAKFKVGCVIDLVGYRRHGHNEGDEPRFTQPTMYEKIDEHPTVREIYAKQLIEEGVVTEVEAEALASELQESLIKTQDELKSRADDAQHGEEPDRISAAWVAIGEPDTAVEESKLRSFNETLITTPEDFRVNSKLKRLLDKRGKALDEDKPSIDWGHAESLAFASLLSEGTPVRLTGQDSGRGTFSHRHAILYDSSNGSRYVPLQHIPDIDTSFEIYNSPLSEYAALGFEYGYSVASHDTLVVWEAQFGDFVNGAEIVIDQFIIAGLAKWNQTSRLTLLLPHGYEGQGPEHSSARLERFLALGTEGNIRVANCSTPAQYFHLMRRQAKSDEIRPLVIMTPKSLLRLPTAASSLDELTKGSFQPVLDDLERLEGEGDVKRLVFCSGKVYYDVTSEERRAEAGHVAVARIELLYPFPDNEVATVIERYPNVGEIVWLQEEPSNMGARKWVVPKLRDLAPEGVDVRWISRPERSSPAEGYPAAHKAAQQRIVGEALA